jgi:diguanylate cyclase (GGDEF)-like protein/PAS domain S-box-containing protein
LDGLRTPGEDGGGHDKAHTGASAFLVAVGAADASSPPRLQDTELSSPLDGTQISRTASRGRPALGALDEVRIQSARIGLACTAAVLFVLCLYGVLPGHYPFSRGPYFVLIGVAILGTIPIALLPWEVLARRGLALPALYAWSLFDIALVSIGVHLTGGSHSDLYLVYLLQCVFMANVSFPRRGRLTLTLLTVAAYVATLAASGWDIGAATLVLRLGMILATAAAADLIAVQLTGELLFRERATAEQEQRAGLWSRVAGLGRKLNTLDEDAILSWAVEAVTQLGLEAANVCEFLDDGRRYRVVHACGLPDSYSRTIHRSDRGVAALVLAERGTVVVDDYQDRIDAIPELRAGGFWTVIATPIWVDGELAAALVGGTRDRRSMEDHEIAAFELLAAHAGRGLEGARRLEHQRRDAAHFRSLIESAPDAMIVMSTDGVVLEANNRVGQLFGYAPEEATGKDIGMLMSPSAQTTLREFRADFARNPRTVVLGDNDDVVGVRKDHSEFPMELVLGPIETPEGVVITATARDMTERREFERRLAHQATHDDLTGLPNRAQFLDNLAEALARSPRTGAPVAVCFLDVDHFKYVNDSRGHTIGDELVVEVARRIASTARSGDSVARFGGDEFAVLVHDLSERKGAVAYAWRLLAAFDRSFVLDGVECYVSASVGVAFGTCGSDPSDVLRQADAAMYHAKQSGRARVEVFDETLTAQAAERLDIESSLHQALLGDQLSVVYQPVITLETGVVTGVEALVRWQHPERGMVPPLAFIPVAEESGLILQIGRWVLARACNQAAAWIRQVADPSSFSVSVNVSNRQLEHDRMIAEVAAALEESGLPPACLVLEITESFFIRDIKAAVRRLQALRRLGVRIAIDDFGTGFSSLSSLSRLPIDVVKIDKSFIDALGTRYDAVIGAVVEVAAAFDLTVVAEGIEREEQRERLIQLGCAFAQGFLFGRPAPPEEVTPLLLASIR